MTAQQLKNSILQMAVQGKLVPQDPSDEPASVLLDRIRAEKEQLIKQKKIKREKNPSYIFRGADNTPYEKIGNNDPVSIADEVPFEIPDTWEWVRCASLGEIVRGSGIKRTETVADGLPCVRYGELYTTYNTSFAKTKSFITVELDVKCKHFGYGDILMTLTGENKPDIAKAVAYLGNAPVAAGGDLAYWTCHRMNPLYLVYALSCPYAISRKVHLATGDIIVHISGDKIGSILLPIPPLEEQARIVARIAEIETLLSKYDATEQQLSSLQSTFPDQLKKSILQMAVQGKLVPQDPADEPASALLERIRTEKQRLVKEGKIKKDKHESVIFRRDNSHYEKLDGIERCIDDEIPFEIPESWCWTRLGTMIGVQRGASPRPKGSPEYWSSERTPHHWIKISDITKYTQNDCLYDTDEFLTDLGATKSVFVDSDYLITAASGSLGKIAKLNISGYIYDGLMCMCFKNTSLEMDYIIILIQAMVEYLMSVSTGTAWKNITTDILKNLLVPLPPLSEQHCIVKKQQELLEIIKLI